MRSSIIDFGISEPRERDIDILAFARTAEKLGFNSIHVHDHVSAPFETLTILTAIAIKTKKLKVATNVLDMNRRNPATTAHVTSTLDHLSGGRLILGAGCGIWNWPTYNVPNVGDRGRLEVSRKVTRAREAIEVLKKFWTESSVTYRGRFYNFENASIGVKPLQRPHPPIWVAGYGMRMKRIAAELGDGFITQTMLPLMYKEEVESVRCSAKEAGRDPMKIKCILAAMTGIGRTHNEAVESIKKDAQSLLFSSARDHADHHNRLAERLGHDELLPWKRPEEVSSEDICQVYLIGTPEEIITRIEEYLKGGMSYLIIMGPCTTDSLRLFSDKVISCFKD
jgi:alkanesulfonate monooxygenase SsuD/methylene tetrahydromethanopterin reductase-like flavin-dependent oxidoreductase (luciferase family)